ncbi:hypothetical protein AMAG_19559 [Allomyces macrogynus ATCC 38327]|uniref:Uncharacterized protein n=1 Tax=Allomyces macrogynus (strain ATCC 38327) TaxID=578462 RepID=A0A0L0SWZ2_ALLM3|nr:hypothetical protein AMAG_19559 [Allomyces macrogynus ATCC 38327]|eukprot:KNE66986.1 hypothetical protein AMAG_19559 [Allomyces macrogynus ATCC 38327]
MTVRMPAHDQARRPSRSAWSRPRRRRTEVPATTALLVAATVLAWLALLAPHAADAQQAADAVLVPATVSGLSPDDCFPIPASSKACPSI